MKTKVTLALLLVVAITGLRLHSAEAEDASTSATDAAVQAAVIEANIAHLVAKATEACARLRQYVEELEQSEPPEEVPTQVHGFLQQGCDEADTLSNAAPDGDIAVAEKHYRAATRALAKVSRWFLERAEQAVDDPDKTSAKRLEKVLKRMHKQITKLDKRAEKLGLEVDCDVAYTLSQKAEASLNEEDLETAIEDIQALKQAIFDIEDEMAEQQEGGAV